jgi:hypothetical protein
MTNSDAWFQILNWLHRIDDDCLQLATFLLHRNTVYLKDHLDMYKALAQGLTGEMSPELVARVLAFRLVPSYYRKGTMSTQEIVRELEQKIIDALRKP